jgi:TolB protein
VIDSEVAHYENRVKAANRARNFAVDHGTSRRHRSPDSGHLDSPTPRWLPVCVGAMLLAGCTSSGTPTPGSSPSSGSGAVSAGAPTTGTLKGQIAFGHDGTLDNGHEQIYLERADGSNFRQVVHSGASDVNPALSPDGRRLAFTRRGGSKRDRIFVVNVDGSGLTQLVPSSCPDVCGDSVEGSGWSPDARTLAFTRAIFHGHSTNPTNIELWLMNTASSVARRLTRESVESVGGRPGAQDNFASWSPDGKRLVFTHWVHAGPGGLDQFAVEMIKPDGTDLRQVTPSDVQAGEPVWSPDGTLIAFQSPPDPEGVLKSLYTIRPDGTGMAPLTNNLLDGADSDHPTWSPDSSQIAFSHVPPGSATGADLYVVNRDGSQPRPVAVTSLNENAPSWGVEPS